MGREGRDRGREGRGEAKEGTGRKGGSKGREREGDLAGPIKIRLLGPCNPLIDGQVLLTYVSRCTCV